MVEILQGDQGLILTMGTCLYKEWRFGQRYLMRGIGAQGVELAIQLII